MKRFTLVLATLLFLATLGSPAHVAAKDNWLSVRSKNFLLVGNASEKQIRQVGTRLEQFREVFSRLFPKAVHTTPVPTTVIVFKSDSSYRPFKSGPNVAGYFQSGEDVNYITLTTELSGEQNPFTVIFHEYTHLLINNTSPNVPLWFNEGLAEYYSTFRMTEDAQIVLGSPISSHVYNLRQNKMLPLRTLFSVDEKSPFYNERDKQSVFYAQSWALMHYLILGRKSERAPQMAEFLKLITENVPLEQAFQNAFSMNFESMEKELRDYIKNDRYPVLNGHFPNKLDVETELQTTPLSEAEAQAYLGDLLLHINRAESETYLNKALALAPEQPMANASLAMLRLREGKADVAREILERAAKNSQNYLIHYYYAYALSRVDSSGRQPALALTPEAAATIRAELKKAMELRPDFLESHVLLAFVNVVTNTNIDESVQMVKRALVAAPGKSNLLLMLAQLYMRQENFKDARALLEQLSGNGGDVQVREHAQALLAQLASIEELRARYNVTDAPHATDSGAGSPPELQERAATVNLDPMAYLRDALRKPNADETQLQGTLERIDCDAKGIVFVVSLGGKVLRLRTDNFETIKLTSFSADAGSEISCGPRKPQNNVIVSYVARTEPRKPFDGTLRSVEFVPKDFQLKAAP